MKAAGARPHPELLNLFSKALVLHEGLDLLHLLLHLGPVHLLLQSVHLLSHLKVTGRVTTTVTCLHVPVESARERSSADAP